MIIECRAITTENRWMQAAETPDSPSIQTEVQVMFFDTDCAGVVHNIAYLRFIEIARTLLAEQLGMGLVDMAKTQTYPVVIRTEIDYRKPAVLADKLVVHGRLESVDRIRFGCSFEIRRPLDGALIVTSRQMLAVIQMPPGKPLRLPEDWAVRFAHLAPVERRFSRKDRAA
ncbi:MAG TPA: thioesterase family protein [Chthoniobacteraceae bacterium]|jgi:YbgC/YbaW family acyl-CoA thioester hydrolase|nr:thioesterase family protein [Chthoniobacteraceae bacterium]